MRRPPRWIARALLCAFLSAAVPLAAVAQAERSAVPACPAWPGEPDPLPTVDAPERAEAEWALARSQELARLARILEVSRPIEAHRFWQHARCLAPDDAEVARGARRAVPLNVHRALGAGVSSPLRASLGDATDLEGALLLALTSPLGSTPGPSAARPAPVPAARPVVPSVARPVEPEASRMPEPIAAVVAPVPEPVAAAIAPTSEPAVIAPATEPAPVTVAVARAPVSAPPPGQAAGTAAVDRSLARLAELIEEARFRTALEALPDVRRAVEALPDGSDQRARAARVELLAGTAQIALGQNDAAREHFRRALRADPSLEMDPNQSRKVRRAFDAARDAS